MRDGRRWQRLGGPAVTAVLVAALLMTAAPPSPAAADPEGLRLSGGPVESVAPGVTYRQGTVESRRGATRVHLVTVYLGRAGLSAGLLHAGAVAAREPVGRLAELSGAVAAVNGDFFNIEESQHPGIEPTGAPVGPEVENGLPLKAAVPTAQRFGAPPPPGTGVRDVLGATFDGRIALGRLTLHGTVRRGGEAVPLGGLNQYALPVDGIGAFTTAWGPASRARAVCGTDLRRGDPCSVDTYEVTVRRGRVAERSEAPGSGRVAEDSVVLLGREGGARYLRTLRPGDPVSVDRRLVDRAGRAFRWALGAAPLMADGQLPAGLDDQQAEPRTAVGVGADGRTLFLLCCDGRGGDSAGLTVRETARLLRGLGARTAAGLDGGGSSTLVTRDGPAGRVVVRNHLDGGQQRPVPNGVGIFTTGR
ncbi:phosphodiester glycosidase family protein [Kitasatospora sp. NPDC094015]|uniref:phosphodiester glycosidase family protein n=1 Tax=Kitasatospora sp. NPDC094015 TaxID=3155205 RepID=UPI00331B95AF